MTKLDFSKRAKLHELMDGPCSYEELRACLHDIAMVNRLTFAHRPTMLWLDEVISSPDRAQSAKGPLRLVDVGCGYGDLLRQIERWTAKRGVAMELTGVDINASAVRAAREVTPDTGKVRYLSGDVYVCVEAQDADLITATTMTHHLSEPEIVRLLRWMEQTTRVGWIINDLHRMPFPYRLFSVAARGPWWHRFIRHDGMASIRRAFREEDWVRMCAAAGLGSGAVRICAHRPARLVVSRMKVSKQ